jgi:hypothetical protein
MSILSTLTNWFARATSWAGANTPTTGETIAEPRAPLTPAPPPFVDDDGVLCVSGTSRADVIVLSVDVAAGNVNVVVNDIATQFALASVTAVHVDSGDGRDELRISESVPGEFTLPVVVNGAGERHRSNSPNRTAA